MDTINQVNDTVIVELDLDDRGADDKDGVDLKGLCQEILKNILGSLMLNVYFLLVPLWFKF